jgi:hypothetical protein
MRVNFTSLLRFFLRSLGWLLLVAGLAWAFGALWYDFPLSAPAARHGLALVFLVGAFAALLFPCPRWRTQLGVATSIIFIACWWLTLRPSNDRLWQPDVARTAWADINGDIVTFHNVRNFDYHHDGTATPHWETRTVRLSHLTGLDLAVNYWGSPWMAHPIASFQFSDAPPLCFSIETRREIGENYSAIGGLYRQYELITIVADERDVLRMRTNYHSGEDIFLYRIITSPDQARVRFMEYVTALDALRTKPRWYHAITTNCTTAIRTQRPAKDRMPWDWRILVNGKGDEMMYERRLIETDGLPFAELKRRSWINDRAREADQDPDFSRRIREGLPTPPPAAP